MDELRLSLRDRCVDDLVDTIIRGRVPSAVVQGVADALRHAYLEYDGEPIAGRIGFDTQTKGSSHEHSSNPRS